ncbi:lipopolysaccharide heptosyltransferase I [Candidatus Venteria ishoeyi]|uniref:Lipopolysaccharide heptosyltransferase 1 n=1 Tax=Candidatus Venteria ishoeyi TaxID=1899563 RepID=A0A1H6FC75_9GAMM|nr:lipopolysaccharide heptosyltransferase I [Candidatus Venteria ishoeyi]MDM8548007.1 lipopolysaccharide heptosyltransferase I [Candidatus Venteria ishoeyi]SEH07690.1 Lipopolysaccharide heptosyltransferase 1 [Candidatus Venteria ishoeyi]
MPINAPKQILIIKLSSLGDVIHTLPALTDAKKHHPDITFDWVVEDAFSEIPTWHPAVSEVIPANLRSWRKNLWRTWRSHQWQNFKAMMQSTYYDQIIDAQGLLKSSLIARYANGQRYGLDYQSAREPVAAFFYHQRFAVAKGQHAITRTRSLFAQALDYPLPDTPPEYGLSSYSFTTLMPKRPTLVFLHGTTWASKHWPDRNWVALAKRAAKAGFRVRVPWGNEAERRRAEKIADVHEQVTRMGASNLQGLAAELSTAVAVVGVDTGLAHLAAALNVPSLTLYTSTNPGLTGTLGKNQLHLQADFPCAPCFQRNCHLPQDAKTCYDSLPVDKVWDKLMDTIAQH